MSITAGPEGQGTLVDSSEVQFFQQMDDIPVTTLAVTVDSSAGDVLIRVVGIHKVGYIMKSGESQIFRLGHGQIKQAYATGANGDAIRWGSVSNSLS